MEQESQTSEQSSSGRKNVIYMILLRYELLRHLLIVGWFFPTVILLFCILLIYEVKVSTDYSGVSITANGKINQSDPFNFYILLSDPIRIFENPLTIGIPVTFLLGLLLRYQSEKIDQEVKEQEIREKIEQEVQQAEERQNRWREQQDLENQPFPSGFSLLWKFEGHKQPIFFVAWSPDGTILASASDDKTICLWDVQTGKPLSTLSGHADQIESIAWSPDGRMLASASDDKTICLWDALSGDLWAILTGHTDQVRHVAWSSDGTMLASASRDKTIRLWKADTRKLLGTLSGHDDEIRSVAWSPDGTMLASASVDETVQLWKADTRKHLATLQRRSNLLLTAVWSPDGALLAFASTDKTIRLWDAYTRKLLSTPLGYSGEICSVVWSPNGTMLASSSDDGTIRLWNIKQEHSLVSKRHVQLIRTLEGHTERVSSVVFSPDNRFLVSKSSDGTVRLWNVNIGELRATLNEPSAKDRGICLAFHPTLPRLATLGQLDTIIRIWELDFDAILDASIVSPTVSYTNAKVVLMGDSGVGKSGLGLVLSREPFALTESTHARRVWTFDQRQVELEDGQKEVRETLLWDLAGQPTYRIIHQLHLNEVAVALVVFDARSETDPFAGVQYWDRAIRQAQRVMGIHWPIKKFLVAARTDRGSISVSQERIQLLVEEMGFDGYIDTSAKEGWHIAELQEMIRQAIAWDDLPKVSSTQLFQQIKTFLVEEKKSGRLLSTVDDLYSTLLKLQDAPQETPELRAQFETCIGRVEAAGLIKRLSFGKLVLLQPELLDGYASALVNVAREDPDSLGSISEEQVRRGAFRMPEDERIEDKEQEKLLLIAMVEDLLRRELVLREESLLVFPAQSTRENPDLPDPEGKAVVFKFEGPVLNIYTTLAVRLSHSGLFRKKALWKNAITYTASRGGMCGIFLKNIDEGRGELTLFFDPVESASEETRINFEDYIALHLERKAIPESTTRLRVFVCKTCNEPLSERTVQARRARGFDWLNCPVCNERISLLDREERLTITISREISEMDEAADSQRDREAAKSIIQGKQATNDFDVFLCHHGIDKPAIKEIGERLKEQGLLPWLDEWELPPGRPWQPLLEQQIKSIKAAAVFVGQNGTGPWHLQEIYAFLREFAHRDCPVIPVLLANATKEPKLPLFLQGMTWVDFRQEEPDPMQQLIWGITGEKRWIR